jgi:superfamily I DNA/RNA helicase
MNNLKIPNFIPGPPGTGKTHKWLKNKYVNLLKKYPWDRIVILSHTNTAADEIIKAVNKLPELKNVPDTNLQDQICTIHSYFRAEYLNIKKYEREDHKIFCKENSGMNIVKKNTPWEKHPLYEFISHAHGKGYDLTSNVELEKYWALCERSRYQNYRLQGPGGLLELKKKYDTYRNNLEHKRVSFVDMIDNFRFKSEIPKDIDVLIVDEAQDCSKPQIHALQIAATHAKEFIFIGDADQTIHEYAGSDPEYFYQLANTEEAKANELTEGLRCGQTINKICRNIIAPVWHEYGRYSERTWTPTDVVGKSYYIPRLDQGCKAKDILINKILNTDETFLFTYRGNPTHKSINTFLQDNGIDYKTVSGGAHVSREHFSCFKNWKTFMNDKVSKQQVKEYWKLMGSKIKVNGLGDVDKLKSLRDKGWNMQELIDEGYLKPEVKQFETLSEVLNHEALSKNETLISKIPYINKVLTSGMDTTKKPRVKHDTIHKVKGLTFDNIIVDLSVWRPEPRNFEPTRLAYVAYSRGKTDCWTIGSSGPYSLAKIQDNWREILEL